MQPVPEETAIESQMTVDGDVYDLESDSMGPLPDRSPSERSPSVSSRKSPLGFASKAGLGSRCGKTDAPTMISGGDVANMSDLNDLQALPEDGEFSTSFVAEGPIVDNRPHPFSMFAVSASDAMSTRDGQDMSGFSECHLSEVPSRDGRDSIVSEHSISVSVGLNSAEDTSRITSKSAGRRTPGESSRSPGRLSSASSSPKNQPRIKKQSSFGSATSNGSCRPVPTLMLLSTSGGP